MQWINAATASRRLGIKRSTLYTYVSRGWIRTSAGTDGRSRRYSASDVDDLAQRARAHRGNAAAAGSAMRWGEPIIDSAITAIDADGPYYRGVAALTLVERDCPFEQAAELLWGTGRTAPWPAAGRPPLSVPRAHPIDQLAVAVPQLALLDPQRGRREAAVEHERGRRLIAWFATWVSGAHAPAARVAETLCRGWRVDPRHARLFDAALTLVADHELNASTFAARVTAATGADTYSGLSAALGALSGPRHGRNCDRIEALLASVPTARDATDALSARLSRGEPIDIVQPRVYPHGDPRSEPILALLAHEPGSEVALATFEALAALGYPAPPVDGALAAIQHTLQLPPGASTALFAVGRTAGWIAHMLEQRTSGKLLRPRARYVGTWDTHTPD